MDGIPCICGCIVRKQCNAMIPVITHSPKNTASVAFLSFCCLKMAVRRTNVARLVRLNITLNQLRKFSSYEVCCNRYPKYVVAVMNTFQGKLEPRPSSKKMIYTQQFAHMKRVKLIPVTCTDIVCHVHITSTASIS